VREEREELKAEQQEVVGNKRLKDGVTTELLGGRNKHRKTYTALLLWNFNRREPL
jgi:hypothetical protein